jgi:hypothetical protein
LLTGARLGEVLKAKRADFDLQRGVWTKPSHHTKQKRCPTNAAGDAIGRVSQVSDPIVVLRHEDEVPVVARVAMENKQCFVILIGTGEWTGEPAWKHKPLGSPSDLRAGA